MPFNNKWLLHDESLYLKSWTLVHSCHSYLQTRDPVVLKRGVWCSLQFSLRTLSCHYKTTHSHWRHAERLLTALHLRRIISHIARLAVHSARLAIASAIYCRRRAASVRVAFSNWRWMSAPNVSHWWDWHEMWRHSSSSSSSASRANHVNCVGRSAPATLQFIWKYNSNISSSSSSSGCSSNNDISHLHLIIFRNVYCTLRNTANFVAVIITRCFGR